MSSLFLWIFNDHRGVIKFFLDTVQKRILWYKGWALSITHKWEDLAFRKNKSTDLEKEEGYDIADYIIPIWQNKN